MALLNPARFFDAVRRTVLGPTLSPDEVSGCEAIMAAGDGLPSSHVAYMLATAYLETAHSMQPIKELGGQAYFTRRYDISGNPAKAKELGNLRPGDGARYAGRGYVQLTGRSNYAKLGKALGIPLEDDPDLALVPIHAASIMREGMTKGYFTGKKLSTYLPDTDELAAISSQFQSARRIINGTDRASEISGYAMDFQSALRLGQWRAK